MEKVLTVLAWFVAIPSTIVVFLIASQFLIASIDKRATLKITGIGWILYFIVSGLSWGYIFR